MDRLARVEAPARGGGRVRVDVLDLGVGREALAHRGQERSMGSSNGAMAQPARGHPTKIV